MFNKLLNEKNRYILVNIIFSLSLLTLLLLVIALLKESVINALMSILNNSFNNALFTILFISFSATFIGYIIYKSIYHQSMVKGGIVYISSILSMLQLFNLSKVKYYFSRLTVENVLFIKKFIFILLYILFIALFIYSICIGLKFIWNFIKKKVLDYDPPKINNQELLQAVGIYYLDFEYDKNLTYYVTYENNGKIIKEDLTNNKLLCLVGELLPNEEYEIKLYSLGKFKAKFTAIESKETIKFTLNRKPTDLQERIAYYYHYSPELIDCYISLLQIFDKMFKRLLIHSPEVIIIESLSNKTIFSKIYLDKENIIVRFNANPYLLEGFNVINSFEEDCMYPTKFIIRSLDDVEYMKKIVDKIKSFKK